MNDLTAEIAAVWAWRQNALRAIAVLPTLLSTAVDVPISDESDLVIAVALNNYCNPIPRWPVLAVEHLSEQDARNRFRFTIDEMKELVIELDLGVAFTVNRVTVTSIFALALLLRRLVWSYRYYDLSVEFGYDDSSISHHINHLLLLLVTRYRRLLSLWPGITQQYVADCERAVGQRSPAVRSIWSFLDGTLRRIAKPKRRQRLYYSGYKRLHALNYQTVVTPDGLIASLRGPFPGSRNDVGVWQAAGLEQELTPIVVQGGVVFHIFGDKAYQGVRFVMTPFKPAVTPAQKLYNTEMSRLRVSVEHSYSRVTNLWSFTEVKRMQRSLLQPVGAYYYAMTLFTNLRTCMDGGNQISEAFDMAPPTVAGYLSYNRR